jgi:hypothetical protein
MFYFMLPRWIFAVVPRIAPFPPPLSPRGCAAGSRVDCRSCSPESRFWPNELRRCFFAMKPICWLRWEGFFRPPLRTAVPRTEPAIRVGENLASRKGFEPLTYGLGNRRSILLSYRDVATGAVARRKPGLAEKVKCFVVPALSRRAVGSIPARVRGSPGCSSRNPKAAGWPR